MENALKNTPTVLVQFRLRGGLKDGKSFPQEVITSVETDSQKANRLSRNCGTKLHGTSGGVTAEVFNRKLHHAGFRIKHIRAQERISKAHKPYTVLTFVFTRDNIDRAFSIKSIWFSSFLHRRWAEVLVLDNGNGDTRNICICFSQQTPTPRHTKVGKTDSWGFTKIINITRWVKNAEKNAAKEKMRAENSLINSSIN